MMVELDLQKKYDTLLNINNQLNASNDCLKTVYNIRKSIERINSECYQCMTCFGFTNKKKVYSIFFVYYKLISNRLFIKIENK